MLLGYNTNGMAHHDLFDAVRLLAEIGYGAWRSRSTITALSPKDRDGRNGCPIRRLLEKLGMRR